MGSDLPVIDLEPLLTSGDKGARKVAREIGAACRDQGFFYMVNHGVSPALRTAAYAASAAFFALPEAQKQTVSYFNSAHNRGYTPVGGESLDPQIRPDAKETFNIGREPTLDDTDLAAGTPFHGPNQWPDLPGFRATMLEYYAALRSLGVVLHRAFARDLGLAPDFFDRHIDLPMAILRLLHYPPHPGQFDGSQYGAAPHTDYGNLTILDQDDVGGLEVRARDGSWIAAAPIADSYVCNVGDCLMRWSNDIYVSTPHRVVNRGGRERYSIAFFFDPNADAEVACLPDCATADRPARYPPIRGAEYLRERLTRTYDRPVAYGLAGGNG